MAIWTMEYHRRIWNLMQAAVSGVNLTQSTITFLVDVAKKYRDFAT